MVENLKEITVVDGKFGLVNTIRVHIQKEQNKRNIVGFKSRDRNLSIDKII